MNESILLTIKKLLGIDASYAPFNMDVIIQINTALRAVNQLGIGTANFEITGDQETWADFLGDNQAVFSLVKTYIYGKVRLVFDPPTSSSVMQALKEATDECEWRLIELADGSGSGGGSGGSGTDGFSPIVTITQITGGHRITITDVEGDHVFDVLDGSKGAKGDKGDKGDTGATGPQGPKGDKGDAGETGATGPQGPQGPKGDPGVDGKDGKDGEDGYTPVKGVDYFDGAQGPKGDKGDKGDDGYSPSASVSKSGTVTTITVTDKSGTTTAQVNDGTDGQDGYSPSANVSKSGDTVTITVTDKNGTTTATVKDGADGQDGADGHSPVVTASKTGKVTTVSVDGTAIATINDGEDGATPVKGVDYWTAQDQAAIVQDVLGSQEISALQTKAITDTGGYYTTDTVEGALQEIGAEIAGVNTLIGTGVIS